MWRNGMNALVILAALGTMAGCSDDVTDPLGGGNEASASEAADLALEADLLTEEIVNAELDSMSAALAGSAKADGEEGILTDERTFSRTRSCPGGGSMTVEGTILRSYDPATGVMEADASGSRTRTDCTFVHGEMSVTINGIAQWEKFRRRVDGLPDGLQTSHYFGSSTAVRSDGSERSCEFDHTVVRDPENHTITIDGTFCGNRIRHHRAWQHPG